MEFFTEAVGVLQTLVILIGAGLGVWGIVNLLEGYGNDNAGAKSQGMKQFMSGAGLVLLATLLIPQLSGLFAETAPAAANSGFAEYYYLSTRVTSDVHRCAVVCADKWQAVQNFFAA